MLENFMLFYLLPYHKVHIFQQSVGFVGSLVLNECNIQIDHMV